MSVVCPRLGAGALLGGLALALGVTAPRGAAAQELPDSLPAPSDTLAVDTLAMPLPPPGRVAADSAAADSMRPPPQLVEFTDPIKPGFGAGVWTWDREALLASSALTLADLLEVIPGLTPIRSGYVGLPQAVNAFGLGGGRVEIVLDGFVLDPLNAGAFDLSRFELVHLRRVRVERGMGRLRVHIETLTPIDPRPYTLIAAGRGDRLSTEMLRGVFLAPRVLGGPLGLGVERLNTEGVLRAEPATTFAGWLKWGRISQAGNGVTLELRRTNVERGDNVPIPGKGVRNDWVLRARGQPLAGLTTEAFVGRSTLEDELGADTTSESSLQTGIRALYDTDTFWGRTDVRLRASDGLGPRTDRALPGLEAELVSGVRLPNSVASLSGSVNWADWGEGTDAFSVGLRGEVEPFDGIRAFAEASRGDEGVPFVHGPDDESFLGMLTDREAYRAGAELARGGLSLGGAALLVDTDSVASFGLPFDTAEAAGPALFPGGRLRGWEATARIPLFWEPLSLEGGYTGWFDGSPWIYTPTESWRAALVYHHVPLASGNLEIQARVEGNGRGPMRVPVLPEEDADAALTTAVVDALTTLDFYLQIRIVNLRAFLRWENILDPLRLDPQFDLPGRALAGQRLMYGVKWEFWN